MNERNEITRIVTLQLTVIGEKKPNDKMLSADKVANVIRQAMKDGCLEVDDLQVLEVKDFYFPKHEGREAFEEETEGEEE